jgi:NAD-dependent deacetylase
MPAPSDSARELRAADAFDPHAERLIGAVLARALGRPGPVVLLTGAGISAESGVPTFRGQDGYWRVGSVNYHPQQLATIASFERIPREVWSWYLYRRRVCSEALPSVAHFDIARLQGASNRTLLVTQNVDGLHRRAGSPPERPYEIHGNIERMRCLAGCGGTLPLPPEARDARAGGAISEALLSRLTCPTCGGLARPHVLFFDETYDEPLFRFESTLAAARAAALLVVVGTTGTTNLHLHVGNLASQAGATLVVVNPEPNPFSQLALGSEHGLFLQGTAGGWVPVLTRLLGAPQA